MRRSILAALLVAGIVYSVAPFRAAWELRQAVRAGDVGTLERRVDWPAVRASLKLSAAETHRAIAEVSEAATVPPPSLWQRIKTAAATAFLADPIIDRYITPEGVIQLHRWRSSWRQNVRPTLGLAEPASVLTGTWFEGGWLDRTLSVARRVERAAFTSPMRVEIEFRDRYVASRRYRAALSLTGWTWRLTAVHLLGPMEPPKPAAIPKQAGS